MIKQKGSPINLNNRQEGNNARWQFGNNTNLFNDNAGNYTIDYSYIDFGNTFIATSLYLYLITYKLDQVLPIQSLQPDETLREGVNRFYE
jgi:hypothetical protein